MSSRIHFWIECHSSVAAVFALACSTSFAAEPTSKELYARTRPSVVLLTVYGRGGKVLAQGSGFAVGEGNTLVTSYHVINGGAEIRIKASDRVERSVSSVLAYDRKRDLAVLTCDPLLPAIPLADNKPEVGDNVIALGNPHGLEASLSQGLVSGVREDGNNLVYQVTAPISPGSSGGPVVNERGEAIGVATFTFRDGQNLNFAVPAEFVRPLLSSTRPTALTVLATDLTSFQRREMEIFKLLDSQLFSLALQKGKELIQEGDSNPDFLLILGHAAVRADENGLAAQLLEQVVAATGSRDLRSKAWAMLIFAYTLQGKYVQALHAYDAGGIIEQVNGQGLLQLYLTQLAARDFETANVTATRILGLSDGRNWLQRFLGLNPEDRVREAQRALDILIRRNLRRLETQ